MLGLSATLTEPVFVYLCICVFVCCMFVYLCICDIHGRSSCQFPPCFTPSVQLEIPSFPPHENSPLYQNPAFPLSLKGSRNAHLCEQQQWESSKVIPAARLIFLSVSTFSYFKDFLAPTFFCHIIWVYTWIAKLCRSVFDPHLIWRSVFVTVTWGFSANYAAQRFTVGGSFVFVVVIS